MNKSIKLLVFTSLLGLLGCNNPMKKSIIEPIPIEDLKTILEKDSLFGVTYKEVQKIREAKLTDDVEKAKWSDMTYYRIHKIVKFYRDTLEQVEYIDKIKSDWNMKYGKDFSKVDSISKYWKNYKKEKSLNNYVNVELFDIQTRENGRSEIGFKFSPLVESIDGIDIDYEFNKKGTEVPSYKKFSYLNDRYNNLNNKDKITEPKIIWKYDYKNQDILENKLLEEVLDQYNFDFRLNSIKVNGVKLSYNDTKIPRSIDLMLEYEQDSSSLSLFEYYKTDVIKEFINENFVRFGSFKYLKLDSISRIIDPKVMEFWELNSSD